MRRAATAALALLALSCALEAPERVEQVQQPAAACDGDGTCEAASFETCRTCPADCPVTCGDGCCTPDIDCPEDCLVCGDDGIGTGEECDDGEQNSDSDPDACRTNCRLPYCGDGVVDTGESCDDHNTVDPDFCLYAPMCRPNVCGDHVLNQAAGGETCDEAGAGCTGDCLQDLDLCGNGALDPGEGCDLGPTLNSDVPNADCRSDCQVARCGDGIVDDDPRTRPAEACDREDGCGPDCTFL